MEIVFATHSISEDNEAGVATGWLPGRLSERGRELARTIAVHLPRKSFDRIYCSDLTRAIETAELAYGPGAGIIFDVRLRECNYGRLNGTAVSNLAKLRRSHIEVPFPDGESYRQVCDRVASFLADLKLSAPPRVLIIGHSATRWSLDCLLRGVPLEELVDAPFEWQQSWTYQLSRR